LTRRRLGSGIIAIRSDAAGVSACSQEADECNRTVPTGIRRINAHTNENIGIDGVDDWRVDVDVVVIDTGVDFNHPDLNVVCHVDCIGGSCSSALGTGGDDDHGHGT